MGNAGGIVFPAANDGTIVRMFGSGFSGTGYMRVNLFAGPDGLTADGNARTLTINAAGTSINLSLSNIIFNTHGTGEAMRIVVATKNVGINTAGPSTKLDVNGSLRASSATISSLGAGIVTSDASGNLSTGGSIANASGWTVSGSTVYKTDTNGNVGIIIFIPKNF